MNEATTHWTERSVKDFLYRIAADFVNQLEKKMESVPLSKADLAGKIGVTKGRVSQILNNPGNLTLEKIIQYARAVGLKIAIVAYDDEDSENKRGPINSEIFNICWENAKKPADFWSLQESHQATTLTPIRDGFLPFMTYADKSSNSSQSSIQLSITKRIPAEFGSRDTRADNLWSKYPATSMSFQQ